MADSEEKLHLSPLRRLTRAGGLTAEEHAAFLARGQTPFERSFHNLFVGDSRGGIETTRLRAQVNEDPAALAQADAQLALNQARAQGAPNIGPSTFSEAVDTGEWGDYLQNVAGSGLGSFIPGIVGGLAGGMLAPKGLRTFGSVLGAAVPSYGLQQRGAAAALADDPELQAALGSPEEQLRHTQLTGAAQTLPEALLPGVLAAARFGAGPLAKLGGFGRTVGGAFEEGLTEGGQNLIAQAIDRTVLPDRPYDLISARDDAIAGALVGGALAGGSRPQTEDGGRAPPRQDGIDLAPPAPPGTPDDGGAGDLFDTLYERFGPDTREQAQSTKDYVSDTIDRMREAADTAQSPSDFLRQVFGRTEDAAAADLRHETEDPVVLNAPDPAAALQERDAQRQERAAIFAAELLNDPATPAAIKERVASFGGDFSSREAQEFVARNLVALRAGEKLANAVADLIDLVKDLGGKARDMVAKGMSAATDRIVKKNLQDINEADIAPLVTLMAQRLGPTKAAEAPKLARQLVAAANRLSPDARITEETDRRLRNFSDVIDDEVLDLVTELSGSDALRNTIAKIRSIPSASTDVRQSGGQSFLESMLKQPLEPAVLGQLAEFVDTLGLQLGSMPVERKNQVLGALASAFGSKREAQIVVEYYGNIRREALRRAAEAGTLENDPPSTDDDAPGEAVATLENPDGTLSYGAEFGTLTEQDAVEMTASYRDPNPARPFFRATDRADLRAARRAAPPGSRVATLREYVATTDESPQAVAARVRQDLRKRLRDAENRDTATVQEAIAAMEAVPESERSEDFKALLSQLKSRKTENRTDLPKLRKQMEAIEKASGVSFKEIADLNRRIRRAELAEEAGINNDDIANLPALRKQLAKLEDRYAKNAEKVLEKYAVVMRPKDETFADDELMAKFRGLLDKLPNANVGTPAERAKKREAIAKIKKTAIKFNRKGGKPPITLSAESMAYASQARGSMKERFLDSLAAVMTRPDIAGAELHPDILISRQTGLTWGDIAPEKPADNRTERQKEEQKERARKAAWGKQERMREDIETWPKLMAALRDVQRRFLADRLGLTLAPDEPLSLTDLINRFPPAQRRAMRTAANEMAFNTAVGWAQQLSHKLATASKRDYRDESRMRVLEKYIDEQVSDRFPLPERDEFVSEGDERVSARLAREGELAYIQSDPSNVGARIADLETEIDMLEDRLDAVAGISRLEEKYERMIEATEAEIDALADSVPEPEQRDVRVPGPRVDESFETKGDRLVWWTAAHATDNRMRQPPRTDSVRREAPKAEPKPISDAAINALYDIAVRENYGRLNTPEKVLRYAAMARTALDQLGRIPEDARTDQQQELLDKLRADFKQDGDAAFDWGMLFDGMKPTDEQRAQLKDIVANGSGNTRVRRHSFVGAKADPEGAARAQAALDSGMAADLVWSIHGWFRGPDGKLRKEIRSPVLRARVRELAKNLLDQRKGTAQPAVEATSMADLFDGVPGYENLLEPLRQYTLELEDSPEVGAAGMVGVVSDKTLRMSVDGAAMAAMIEKVGSWLLQSMAADGSLDTNNALTSFEDLIRKGKFPELMGVAELERAIVDTLETGIHHELQHVLQGVEGFENGGNPNTAIVAKYGDIDAFNRALNDGDIPEAMAELERARSAMLRDIGPDADAEAVAYELYRNIIGEVEAHDVEYRFKLSDAEAKRLRPELMGTNREYLRGLKVAIEAAKLTGLRQNRQSTVGDARKPPNAKDHAEMKKRLIKEIRRIRGNDVRVRFNRLIEQLGASGEFSMNDDKTDRLIEVAVNAADPLGVAWHESLHDFFAMLGEDRVGRSIKRDLINAANAPHVKKRLRELLAKHPKAREQIENSPEERVAYMYQFWAAGELQLGPTGTGIFEKIRAFFRDLLGLVGRDERALDLLTALHEGKFANPSVVAEVLADMPRDRLTNRLERLNPAITDTLRKLVAVAPDRLRDYQNDHLNRLADMFFSERGELGFIQRRFQKDGEWTNRLFSILNGTTATERRQALENLQAMKAPSSKLERDLAKFFEDMYRYMHEAGVKTLDSKTKKWVPLRQVVNYFPRVFDRDAILKDREGFKNLLMKHGSMTAKAAENIINALIHGTGQLDLAENEHALGFTPYAQSVQDRQLTFIKPENAAEFAKYQVKDLADITTQYVKQAVHRAEYARMFGNQGEKIAQIINDSGITDKKDLADINKIVQGLEGTLGYEMGNPTKELMSGIMTLQNLVLLPVAIFSQMIDPIVLAARSGDVRDAAAAYMTAIKRLVRRKDVDGEDLAEMLGIISQDTVLDAMGVAYGTTHMSKRMRKINRVFFKYNGMQGWNNSMRIAATAAGERYILQNRNNKKALAELGLEPSDIKTVLSYRGAKPDKNGKVTPRERLNVDNPKVKEAMFRFVDQAVLRPSAANRPVWMSDPKFLLVAHLKQFTFAMHNVVLKRATQQLEDGNPKPWAVLMLAMPVILAADMAKFALTGGPPKNWGVMDFIAHAVERSGLLGLGDFGAQAMRGVERGRVPGEALLGPAVEHLLTLLRFLGGSPMVDAGDVIDRTVPGARFL